MYVYIYTTVKTLSPMLVLFSLGFGFCTFMVRIHTHTAHFNKATETEMKRGLDMPKCEEVTLLHTYTYSVICVGNKVTDSRIL